MRSPVNKELPGHEASQALPRTARGKRPSGGILPIALIGFSLAFSDAPSATAESLDEAISSALASHPRVAQAILSAKIANEHVIQARAQYAPKLSAQASAAHQEAGASVAPNYQSVALVATQPLFTGGRVRSAVRASVAEREASLQALRRDMNQIALDAVNAYASLAAAIKVEAIRRANLDALQTYAIEMQTRYDVGASTGTDAAQAKASLQNAQVQLAEAEQDVQQSRNAFEAVVGHTPGALDPDVKLPMPPATLEEVLGAIEARSPALSIARLSAKASSARIEAARSERLPNVSWSATHAYEPLDALAQNTPYVHNTTVSVTFSMPLYDGGLSRSHAREATRQYESDELNVDAVRRATVQAAADAWTRYTTARQVVAYSQNAITAAETAYAGSQEEQKLDQRSTLEVLSAQQTLEGARINRITAEREVSINQAEILFQLGALVQPSPDLRSLDPGTSDPAALRAAAHLLEAAPALIDQLAPLSTSR